VSVPRATVLTAVVLTLCACTSEPASKVTTPGSKGPVSLIDQHAWQPVQASHPFAAEPHASEPACASSFHVEEFDQQEVFEVDTALCATQTFVQPIAVDIAEGVTIVVRGFHFELAASEPAQGHFAVALGETVIAEQYVDIPGPSGGFEGTFKADRAYKTGTPIYFHIHNHGKNKWLMVAIERSGSG
jgi:hypothetical protein